MQKKNLPHKTELHTEKHPKQDFQVERIAFFSDAVFAIAITLLIIDFRPPHITAASTYDTVWQELKAMKVNLGALLLSFGLIISYWMRHHELFKHIHNYNRRIIKANMLILVPIIFFPFTISFLYEGTASSDEVLMIPYRLCVINNLLAAALMYYFFWLVIKKEKEFTYPMDHSDQVKFELTLLVMIVSFALVLLLSFISFKASFWGFTPIILLRWYNRFFPKNKKTLVSHAKQTGGPGH